MTWGDDSYPGSAAPDSNGYDRIGYAWAQCASYANEQIMDQLSKPAVYWGNGGDWGTRAAADGVAVDGSPRPGDVICLPPGVNGAGSFGHVAVVNSISADGQSVWVSDYNWVARGTFGQHWLPVGGGSQFIHVGPAPPPPQPGITWESFSGSVQVNDAHVRNGPGLGAAVLRDVYLGNDLAFDGFCYSDAVWDPVANQWDTRWFHIDQAHGYGWVASALIDGNPPNSHP